MSHGGNLVDLPSRTQQWSPAGKSWVLLQQIIHLKRAKERHRRSLLPATVRRAIRPSGPRTPSHSHIHTFSIPTYTINYSTRAGLFVLFFILMCNYGSTFHMSTFLKVSAVVARMFSWNEKRAAVSQPQRLSKQLLTHGSTSRGKT